MAELTEIQRMIAEALPGAEVQVLDETGSGDHLRAVVRAPQFEGKSRIDQHRMVRAAVQARMDDGSIHALSITTRPAASSASREQDATGHPAEPDAGPPGPGSASR
jgi:stress-induced morphogen